MPLPTHLHRYWGPHPGVSIPTYLGTWHRSEPWNRMRRKEEGEFIVYILSSRHLMTHRIKTIQETFPVVGIESADLVFMKWFSIKMNSCSGTSCLNAVWKTLLPPTAGSQQWTEHLVLYIADPDRGESGFCFDDWGTGQDRFMVFKQWCSVFF